MKTKAANLGLGDAISSRRKNNRIKRVEKEEWATQRVKFFRKNVGFAAAAKAYRVTHDVTQQEAAKAYRRSQGTVCNWESGKYSWRGGHAELHEYFETIRSIV